jgi:hypothetical protein
VRRDPRFGPGVPRRVTGFRQDDEGHWAAELECGHTRHVRHDPPWQVRPWVTTEEGRAAFIGTMLECGVCEPSPPLVPRCPLSR